MRGIIGVLVFLLFLSSNLLATEIPNVERDRAVVNANRMIREGRVDDGLRMFESLYKAMPQDSVVVLSYAEALSGLKRIGEAKGILREFANSHPDNMMIKSRLALMDFLEGDRQGFIKQIDEIVKQSKRNRRGYEVAIDVLEEANEIEKIFEVVSIGRKATGDSTFLADRVGPLCFRRGMFLQGTREYLLSSLTKHASPEIISKQITHQAASPEARQAIMQALENAKSVGQFKRIIAQTLPYVYLLDQRCELAFNQMMDGISQYPDLAVSLADFSRELQRQGCFGECAKAYEVASKQPQLSRKVVDLLMAKAACHKLSGNLQSAAEVYLEIAEKYPKTELGETAMIERARILKDIGEIDSALRQASILAESSRSPIGRAKAILLKGDCQVLLGDLDGAAKTYDLAQLDWQDSLAQEAFFNLGEVAFYRGEFDEAVSYYNLTARQFPSGDRANDAIERLMLLRDSKTKDGYNGDLKLLASAYLLERQGKVQDAEKAYLMLSAANHRTIRAESLKRLAEMARRKGEFARALAFYKVISDSIGGDATPLALEAIGDIYLESGQVERALETYESLIIDFPGTTSAGEARRKIDEIKNRSKERP